MGKTGWIALGLAIVVFGGLYLLSHYYGKAPPPEPPAAVAPAPAPAPPPAPEPHYEVPEAKPAEPPPKLDDSDGAVAQALEKTFGKSIGAFLVPKSLVRHIVATVDSLDRQPVPLRLRPVAPMPGALAVQGAGDSLALSAANAERYQVFVGVLRSVDGQQIAAVYLRFYPLFQQAYEELGYPGRYFNDRLVKVIDHLLATPEPGYPIALVQPNVIYQYADPQLEARSSGQKTLIRMGPENAALVKARLREIRAAIIAGKPAAQ